MTTTRPAYDDASSKFWIRRSLATASGFLSDADPMITKNLQELDALLSKRVLPAAGAGAKKEAKGDAKGGSGDVASLAANARVAEDAAHARAALPLLRQVLMAKKSPKSPHDTNAWADESLASTLAIAQDDPAKLSLAEHIDQTPALAELKYSFQDLVETSVLSADVRTVLRGYSNIADYLIAYAFYVRNIRDVTALRGFITQNTRGARRIGDYAVVSATRALIYKEQLKVDGYNDDASDFTAKLVKTPVPLSTVSFLKTVRAHIEEYVFDRDEEKLIRDSGIGPLSSGVTAALVKYIQASPIDITKANAPQYLPPMLMQIMNMTGAPEGDGTAFDTSDSDSEVQFQDDADPSFEVSRAAVARAGQLYWGMVMGDELDVFGVVNYLTHKRLFTNGGLRIESSILRDDLKSYVFSNEFVDLATGRRMDRTRPAERQMFHRQVFDQGNTKVPDDLMLNSEFRRLWKVLMLESARYLDRAQASMNPESFVSRQNVMQAVEDLQYNLSANCTGMATLISPIADAEINFVLKRILNNPEIVRQIVPEGGTWRRVVDKLNAEQRKRVGTASTLYNKATLGKGMIGAIAAYSPAAFEDDGVFSAFISKVDAFITTQSILRRAQLADLKDEHDEQHESDEGDDQHDESESSDLQGAGRYPMHGNGGTNGYRNGNGSGNGNGNGTNGAYHAAKGGNGAATGADADWDF